MARKSWGVISFSHPDCHPMMMRVKRSVISIMSDRSDRRQFMALRRIVVHVVEQVLERALTRQESDALNMILRAVADTYPRVRSKRLVKDARLMLD